MELWCRACRRKYGINEPIWRCGCGSPLDVHIDSQFPRHRIVKRRPNLWRYREALPLEDEVRVVSFDEGFTPLIFRNFRGFQVAFKLEYLFPTGSFKDRGASLLVSKVRELGIQEVVEDSSGNAAAAIAAYCAASGITCHIYVPETASFSKLTQIRMCGARLVKVPGSRQDTARAAFEAAEKSYYASHYWNPFFFQGTKTFAFEVWEQLGFRVPHNLVIPVGHGTLLLGAYFGFQELKASGMVKEAPRIFAVQSENCCPLFRVFHEGLTYLPQVVEKESLAEGIGISQPLRWKQILEAVKSSQGTFLKVSEEEIVSSLRELSYQGFFLEPTSAVAPAALVQLVKRELVHSSELSVVPLTGTGLKAADKIASKVLDP